MATDTFTATQPSWQTRPKTGPERILSRIIHPRSEIPEKPLVLKLQAKDYESLWAEWNRMPTDFAGRMEWMDTLAKEQGTKYVNDFLEWEEKEKRGDPRSNQLDQVSNEQFVSSFK